MKKLLVIFDKNWADEFDVHGFQIMRQEEYDALIDHLPQIEYNFGTNEGWEQGDFESRDFRTVDIGPREEDFLRTTFGIGSHANNRFGNFPYWEDYIPEQRYNELYPQH